MPTYPSICDICGTAHETILPMSDCHNLPECCGERTRRVYTPPVVGRSYSGLYEYQAVAVDQETGERPVITTKTQHQEFLRRNGYVELGNETPKPRPPIVPDSPAMDIKRACEQAGL